MSALRTWLRARRAEENAQAHRERVAAYEATLEPEPEGGWHFAIYAEELRLAHERFERTWNMVFGPPTE